LAQEAKPPLRAEEVQRILALLKPLSAEAQIVLVGGQALAFWSARFAEPRGEISVVASKDIDFEGSADSARLAGRLLGGEVMIPSPLEPTPVTGVVTFIDSDGIGRSLDFIGAPRGLDAADVRDTALRVDLPSSDGREAIALWVMHPERCMESRVYNTIDLGRDDSLGLNQLKVSIPIARRWSESLLNDGSIAERDRQRAVLDLNERIFKKASEDRCFLEVYRRFGIDPFAAVLDDGRLPQGFGSKRYPQMQQRLAAIRQRPNPPPDQSASEETA
jgi:hypothetical protein